MQDTMGEAGYGMFFMFGSFCFIMGVFVWFFIPETKGISLEKMDELFGVVESSKQIEEEHGSERRMSTQKDAVDPRTTETEHIDQRRT
jgi:hypothetical protein